ncbi:hypothetical protein HET73_05880 [Wolbachia endosymbiont of Atemnus politus]|nr:hypothetical protein [Wolbachia endosymbiont of Atemnus politus]
MIILVILRGKKGKLDELKAIYKGLYEMFTNISIDWDSNKNSLSSEKINTPCQNLKSILEMVDQLQN